MITQILLMLMLTNPNQYQRIDKGQTSKISGVILTIPSLQKILKTNRDTKKQLNICRVQLKYARQRKESIKKAVIIPNKHKENTAKEIIKEKIVYKTHWKDKVYYGVLGVSVGVLVTSILVISLK